MKILNISNNDFDGAGRAVLRLNESFIKLGYNSKFLVLYKKTCNKNIQSISTGKSLREITKSIILNIFKVKKEVYFDFFFLFKAKIYSLIVNFRYSPKNLYNFYNIPFDFKHLQPHIVEADVIILHSIQDMISVEDIGKICDVYKKKLVLHPLDMELITGGYHFSYDCNCYRTGKCNSKKHNLELLAKENYIKKVKVLNKLPCIWIASNNYVLNRIKNSKMFSKKNHSIDVVYFGIEENRYSFYEKKIAKKKLNISSKKNILLFGCSDFGDLRKGTKVINNLLEKLNHSDVNLDSILLLTYGETNNFKVKNGRIEWVHLGTVNDSKKMNLIYRASDIMLSPSLDDLGPTTVQEAFLNDLYIISFELGLAPDLIIHNYNGSIIKNFDNDKFYNAVYKKINETKVMKKNLINEKKINHIKNLCSRETEARSFIFKMND